MKGKVFEFEHKPGEEFVLRFKPPKGMPDSTKSHLRTAGKELLLALRSCVDAAISSIEQAEEPEGKKRVDIDIE